MRTDKQLERMNGLCQAQFQRLVPDENGKLLERVNRLQRDQCSNGNRLAIGIDERLMAKPNPTKTGKQTCDRPMLVSRSQ